MSATLRTNPPVGFQLVFRQKRSDLLPVSERSDVDFVFLVSPLQAVARWSLLRRSLGWRGTIKAAAKLATGRRSLYLLARTGRVVSTGWCNRGLCNHYPVEPNAVVVGPIWSEAECRGQGLATFALKKAINTLVGRGHRLFYIDTFETNLSCQKVIARCEFGAPLTRFPRGTRGGT